MGPKSSQHTAGRKVAPPRVLKPSPSARLPRGTLVAYSPGTSLPVVSQKEREALASPLRASASSSKNKVSDRGISTLPRTCLGTQPLGRLRRTGAPHGAPGGRRARTATLQPSGFSVPAWEVSQNEVQTLTSC